MPVQLLLPRVGPLNGFLSSGLSQYKENERAMASVCPQWHLFTLAAG